MKDYEKKYKEALERAKKYKLKEDLIITQDIFPELAESEDEKIKEELIETIHLAYDCGCSLNKEQRDKYLAWIEKQEEQNNNEDADILQRFSFYSYKDEPNVLYLSGLYVNEECRNKGIGTKILEVADEVAKSLNCLTIRLKTKKDSNAERLYQTHGYNSLAPEGKDEIWLEKQGEHNRLTWINKHRSKPAEWSDKDEAMITLLHNIIDHHYSMDIIKKEEQLKLEDWLKFLKDRVVLKPAEWS